MKTIYDVIIVLKTSFFLSTLYSTNKATTIVQYSPYNKAADDDVKFGVN